MLERSCHESLDNFFHRAIFLNHFLMVASALQVSLRGTHFFRHFAEKVEGSTILVQKKFFLIFEEKCGIFSVLLKIPL